MNFKELSQYLTRLEATSSRIEITKILAELFVKSGVDDIDKITYLVLGILAPGYRGIVFNMADKLMLQAIAKAYRRDTEDVIREYRKLGDLGQVAEQYAIRDTQDARRDTQDEIRKMKQITILQIYNDLNKIAQDEGEGSVDRKIGKMAELLSKVDPQSARFLARIPVGKLRLGFSDKTVLDALSWMETGGKSKKFLLEGSYNILPDVGLLARSVKEKGIDKAVADVMPQIGIPIFPVLAQRLKSPKEMIEKMKKVCVEPKFDGLRLQIHFKKTGFADGTQVKVFTRNLNETSWMFPELKDIGKYIKADEVVLDTEGVGVDEERLVLANFQTTMTRRRKHDIEKIAAKVSIKFYVFDVMYKNGKSFVDLPYMERRKILSRSIVSGKLLQIVDYEITESPGRINEIMRQKLKEGMEGIMVKRVDSKYIAGRTGWRWVKMKEKESAKSKLADTVDCVVMGYSAGRGKRVSFGLGQFLVGVGDGDEIKTVTKVGTGLTDKQFREIKKRLLGSEVKEKPGKYVVNKLLEPDFWVKPSLVVEIAADEITQSPTHSSGFALRFPRLVRFRDDKDPSDATSLSEVKNIFKIQKS